MRTVLTALCLLSSTAYAVPAQFTHQGRLLDAEGEPLEGDITITFRVTTEESGGDVLWEEPITVPLNNGFYSAVLGADEGENPLDTEILSQAPVWLELQLEEEAPMTPRSPIHSVPYANMAAVAEEISGGPVNASHIAVGDTPVVNEAGEWVGPTPAVTWADIEGIPADFADGVDDDTIPSADSFADLGTSCLDGDIPVWDGTLEEWSCTFDQDTLADTDCSEGQIIRWSDEAIGWVCSEDIDTILSASEVDAIVSDNGYAMASDIFSGSYSDLADVPVTVDADTLASLSCTVGQTITQTESGWACTDPYAVFDTDGDGVFAWLDCDDSDAASAIKADDGDCDGIPTALDCDDADPGSTAVSEDADCDGIPTTEDCDDADAASTSIATDSDCDGTLTADDCDDTDPSSTIRDFDADCDGTVTAEDCDDTDEGSTILDTDGDCDGILTADDCDDDDADIDDGIGAGPDCAGQSCKTILEDDPSASSGNYWVDPGGGFAPTPVYCDMETDGGGWTLGVVIHSESSAHVNRAADGTIHYPSDLSPAKLSDDFINGLSAADGSAYDSVYRFTCNDKTDFLRHQNGWNSESNNGDPDFTYRFACGDYSCVVAEAWSFYDGGTSSSDRGGGSYPQFDALQYQADGQPGCYEGGYYRDGLLWVR